MSSESKPTDKIYVPIVFILVLFCLKYHTKSHIVIILIKSVMRKSSDLPFLKVSEKTPLDHPSREREITI